MRSKELPVRSIFIAAVISALIGQPGMADTVASRYRLDSHMQGQRPGKNSISQFSEILKACPNDPVANYNLASCYFVNNEFNKALPHFTVAIDSKVEQVVPPSYVGRGGCYLRLGRLQDALQDFNKAIEHGGPADLSALAYSDRGVCYMMMNRSKESIADFSKAIELNPLQMADPLSNRAAAYLAIGDYQKAIDDSTKCINSSPKTIRAYIARAESYRRTKQYDLAISDCDRGLAIDPNSLLLHIDRASAYRGAGQFEKSLAEANKALELSPNEPMGYANRGEANRRLGQVDDAINDLTKALSLDPSLGLAYHYRSLAYATKGNVELSSKDQENALKNGYRFEDDETTASPVRAPGMS